MRTLSVLYVHLGRRDGGAERQSAALLADLAARGHRVLGIVRRGAPAERRALDAGAPIFPLGPRFPLGPAGVLSWWSRGRAQRIASAGGWDLVHFADPESYAAAGGILAAAAGGALPPARTIVTYRGGRGAGRPPSALRRHHRSGGTIAVGSEALWAALVREGFEEDLLTVVHPGIDTKVFAAASGARVAARRALGLDDGSEVVGTVAVLDRDRRAVDLIEAAAVLLPQRPQARVLIAGDGPERAALESAARRLGFGDRVLFSGWREDVPAFLHALDVFVFSGRGEEVFPCALIEAMAAGIPVVASDQPGIREIIENGKQGLLVPEKGAEAMARTILRVLADPEASRRIGRAGTVRVQRFHTRAMVDGTEALYYRASKIRGEEG